MIQIALSDSIISADMYLHNTITVKGVFLFLEQDSESSVVCEACLDGTVYDDNEILLCDNCNVAVHQSCYSISSIPEGAW